MKQVCMALTALIAAHAMAEPALAVAPFYNEFENMYAKGANANFNALVMKARCAVCHGDKKTVRNVYGQALNKLLTKADKENMTKIQMALRMVEDEKADESGPTFGEKIRSGKLPAAN